MYIVQKYIMASSAADAIKKDHRSAVDEVVVDTKWRDNGQDNLAEAIGFVPSKQQ